MSPRTAFLALGLALALGGCSWGPTVPDTAATDTTWGTWGDGKSADAPDASDRPAARAAGLAKELIGAPYRWGGATPAGFDCSGLVYYTYHRAGLTVPRTSQQQFQAAIPVPIDSALPGDLVFFGRRGTITHVGIYIGDQRFIHAPEAGRTVTIASLGDRYYQSRFAGAGRVGL
jgi:cell wall-associated NlpC family hydrolase